MRRLVRIFLVFLLVAFVAIATLPYWFGAAARRVSGRWGVTYDEYSLISYKRFAIRNLEVKRPGVVVRADLVEADTPVFWLGRAALHDSARLRVGNWKVEVTPTGKTEPSSQPFGWMQLRRLLLNIGDRLERWVPAAMLGSGSVQWPGNAILLNTATWHDRTLAVTGLKWRELQVDATAELGKEKDVIAADVVGHSHPLKLNVRSRSSEVTGQIALRDQVAPVFVDFKETGWIPKKADLKAENWTLPASDLHLAGYGKIQGTAVVHWDGANFKVDADLSGTPESASAPPLAVIVAADGDARALNVSRLDAKAPGVDAHLNAPVILNLVDRTLQHDAAFLLEADLAQMPWFTAAGKARGEVRLIAATAGWPKVDFNLTADGLKAQDWLVEEARIQGTLQWPVLTLTTGKAKLGEQGNVDLDGTCDLQKREVSGIRLQGVVPYAFVEPVFPKAVKFSKAEFVAKADGPWAAVRHEGTATVHDLTHERLQPATVTAWWKGEGRAPIDFEGGIQAADTEVVTAGKLEASSTTINKLIWRHAGEDRLALERPATVAWGKGIVVDAVDLVGKAGELRLTGTWAPTGQVRFFARGIDAAWWRNFVPKTPFDWSIETFSVEGKWDNGPVEYHSSGSFSFALKDGKTVSCQLQSSSDGKQLVVDRLRLAEGNSELANASARLPIQLTVSPSAGVKLGRSEELKVVAVVRPEASWWAELGERSGVHLRRPDLNIQIGGTIDDPRGEARLAVERLEFDERLQPKKWPTVEAVSAVLVAKPDRIVLEPLEARVAGQAVWASVALPFNDEVREQLRKDPTAAVRDHAEFVVRAKDVELAAFETFIGAYLLPQGKVDTDLRFSANSPWSGYLKLSGAGTRPLGAMGPLRSVGADLAFEGRKVRVNAIEAEFGGQPVRVQGEVQLEAGAPPRFDLTAKGENLPFVRQAGMVMRGDVDLTLKEGKTPGVPLIGGKVTMHDGLFVQDVRGLVPKGGGGGPSRRPPYFSVDVPPFDKWRLDVTLEGDRFLRARTTLFNGIASMKFRLTGALADPRAIGMVRVDSGQVLFPFAKFSLEDATVRLTEENPFDPQLAIFGASRRYGYDLKLELTGTASVPNLVFTSSPPLTSEQVLLLVMAGQTPKNEVSYTTTQKFRQIGTFFGQSLLNSLGGGGGEDRLTISSGERISRQGRETYSVEYNLDKRWSLIGEYDEFDEYNAGLKWLAIPKPDEEKKNGRK